MPYICSVCKTPTPREGRCESCGWVHTITVKGNNSAFSTTPNPAFSQAPLPNSIVFLTEDTQHITGGRYYSWWLGTALVDAGFDVHVYTNRLPVFIDSFQDYPQPILHVTPNLEAVDVHARAYFGSPIIGSIQAIKLAEKYGKTAYCEIFDPFPMMDIYKGHHNYPGWSWLIPNMKKPHVKVISLCKAVNPYIYPWLNKREDEVIEVYPCINDKEKDKTQEKYSKRKWITFISRIDHHKKIGHVLDAVRATDHQLHIITSIDGVGIGDMIRIRGMEEQVVLHFNISDKDKFRIIKQSVCTINGSIWEGFGIWLAESLSCGVPAVCYDFPTFHEIKGLFTDYNPKYKDMVYFAQWNDADDLSRQLQKCLKEKKTAKPARALDYPVMVTRMREVMRLESEPRIGVIMIALNEEKFIGASLKAISRHPSIKKIAVVEGCARLNEHSANEDGLSTDQSPHEILKVGSRKIIYDRHGWARDKSELRNRGLEILGKSYTHILVVDADEVWKQDDLDRLADYLRDNPDVATIWFKALHFWKKKDLLAVESQWEAPLFRFFKYDDKTLHWDRHELPVVNEKGVLITELGREVTLETINFYHYGALKDEKDVLNKLEYYAKRDTHLPVKDTWTDWKPGKETQWTHGGGRVEKFTGTHPKEVKGII